MGQGMKRIKGIKTGRFVAINANGDLYSTVRCHLESYFSSLCFSFLLSKGSRQVKKEYISKAFPHRSPGAIFSPLIGTNSLPL